MQNLLVEIFYNVDNYCIAFEKYCRSHFIEGTNCSNFSMIKSRNLSDYRNFKAYYTKYVSTVLKDYFPKLVSCNRFVELMQETLIPLLLYMTKGKFFLSLTPGNVDELYMEDKIILRKRAIIENVNDHLKNVCQIEHSHHRSLTNFMVNIVSGLVAYSFLPKKPSLKLDEHLYLA